MTSKLDEIFEQIRNKELTRIGIQNLYQFQKQNPNFDVLNEGQFKLAGSYFQGYIQRGLNLLVEEEIQKEKENTIKPDGERGRILHRSFISEDLNKFQGLGGLTGVGLSDFKTKMKPNSDLNEQHSYKEKLDKLEKQFKEGDVCFIY